MKKSKWKWFLIVVGVVACLALIGFAVSDAVYIPCVSGSYTLDKPFPDRDIIFIRKWGGEEFGFVNADGSGLEHVRLQYLSSKLKRFLNIDDASLKLNTLITWSSDGRAVFMSTYGYPMPTMLEVNGTCGTHYMLDEKFRAFMGRYRYVSVIPGTRQAVFSDNHLDFPYQPIIGVVELDRDTLILVKYVGVIMEKGYVHLEIGPHPWCSKETLVFVYFTDREQRIIFYNLRTDRQSILDASALGVHDWIAYPSCSPDGRWVAYTTRDGIYLVHPNGSDRQKIQMQMISSDYAYAPVASWSPDGQWIVYHDCLVPGDCREDKMAIFKYNVETGERVKLTDEGMYPYWRQPAEAGRELRLEP